MEVEKSQGEKKDRSRNSVHNSTRSVGRNTTRASGLIGQHFGIYGIAHHIIGSRDLRVIFGAYP